MIFLSQSDPVASRSVFKRLIDTTDGSGGNVQLSGDFRIGKSFVQQRGDLPTLGNGLQFRNCKNILKKTITVIKCSELQYRPEEGIILIAFESGNILFHLDHLSSQYEYLTRFNRLKQEKTGIEMPVLSGGPVITCYSLTLCFCAS